MKSTILIEENSIVFEFDSKIIPKYIFSLSEPINLTDWIIEISNLNENLELIPITYEKFILDNSGYNEKINKVVEYLYKVVIAYNECYNKIFGNCDVELK